MSPFALWPETAWAVLRATGRFFADEFRRTPAYRALLKPVFPEELPAPSFTRQPDRARGADVLGGTWRFRGEHMALGPAGNPWDCASPSRGFARDLHRFGWLPDLVAIGPEGEARAQTLTAQWVTEFGDWNTFSWRPDVLAARLINWLSVAHVIFAGPDADAVFISFARQARHLRLTGRRATGAVRIKALTADALTAATLDGAGPWLDRALARLAVCLDASILADGCPRDRNPTTAADSFIDLIALMSVLARLEITPPDSLYHAMDRLGGILRFLTHDDGALATVQGGYEYSPAVLNAAYARAGTPAGSFLYANEGGYQRAVANGGVVLLDAGPAATGPWSTTAHAGPLAFEYSYRGRRLIVNCGHGREGHWQDLSRLTAAHSTLTAADISCAGVLQPGLRRTLMGARLFDGARRVVCRREDEGLHTWLDATHDGYLKRFGFIHARRLYLAETGDDIRGEDTILWARRGRGVDVAVRFHLHPDVRVTPTRDGQGVLLVDGTGEGWRFKSSARDLVIEPSVYLGRDGRPEKTEQIVLRGRALSSTDPQDPDNIIRWALTRMNRPWDN